MARVTFWFGYNSPYSMLAHHRIESLLAGEDVEIRYRPWFPGLTLPDYESPKVKYVVEDVIRHARAYGLVLRPGPYVDPGAAYRGFLLARDRGLGRAYNERVHRARWFDAADISQRPVLRTLAAECGLDADAFEGALEGGPWEAAMLAESADALDAGVFGHPFFEFDGQKFWGNDRLEWLLAAIRAAAS